MRVVLIFSSYSWPESEKCPNMSNYSFNNACWCLHLCAVLIFPNITRSTWMQGTVILFSTWGCCTASLDTWLRSRSFVSRQTRTTTLTTGHAEASGPRHPVSHTGPYDTTGARERWMVSGRDGGRRREEHISKECHKSVKKNQQKKPWLSNRPSPFIFFTMNVFQTIRGLYDMAFMFNCCQKGCGPVLVTYSQSISETPVVLLFGQSTLSCHQLELTEPKATEMWKICLIPDRIFS